MKRVLLRKEEFNPNNVKRFSGILKNIKSITIRNNEIEVLFEEEPTPGELQALEQFLRYNYWKVIEVVDVPI